MADAEIWAGIAIACAACSGVPGLLWRRHAATLTLVLMSLSAVAALSAAGLALAGHGCQPAPGTAVGALSSCGRWVPLIDGLSAVFLAATGLVAVATTLFALGYWRDREQPVAPITRLFFGLTVAGILAVEVAGEAVMFLVAWEVMALSAFVLVASLHRDPSVRSASWLYLIATRASTICLIAGFILLGLLSGTAQLVGLPTGVAGTAGGSVVFLLFLIGFGLKAGMVPLHFWLPPAHAAAPSHVSALMSGVMIKAGIYGLCRFISLVPDPPLWWGGTIFALGAISAVLGVIWALGSHDLKRLLAYHSIENIGIILLGLGLALVGRSLGKPTWVLLGMAGALLHVLNHALFKSLLFLGAGAVDHACGTRALDRLGGLAKAMPVTAVCFLVGAAAICGLPPFNGFCSEWLIYLGLFAGSTGGWLWAAAGLTALVLVGGLALACFAKAGGVVFLGSARSPAAARAHEAGTPERVAMIALAAACLAVGLGLPLLAPLLHSAALVVAPELSAELPALTQAQPLWLSACAAALLLLGVLLWRWQARRVRIAGVAPTWDCGYAAPDARMQYTATSFAAPLVGELRSLQPREQHRPALATAEGAPATAERLFPERAAFSDHPLDPVLDLLLLPIGRIGAWLCRQARVVHPGWLSLYLIYIVFTLAVLLFWSLR